MKAKISLLTGIFSISLSVAAVNPIAQYYHNQDYPTWTNSIKWNNQINMSTYATGANNFEKFENARDALYAQGGGVLYYPAGTYDFSIVSSQISDSANGRGLMLKSGVIILGQAPTTDSNAVDDGAMALQTTFKFKYITKNVTVNGSASTGKIPCMWSLIGITPAAGQQLKDVNNVGICWVRCDGATVYFGAQFAWGPTWATAGSWFSSTAKPSWAKRVPNGTHYLDPFAGQPFDSAYHGAGKGRIVFGCVLENATPSNDVINNGAGATSFYTYPFAGRISVYGSNVLVANNAIAKPTNCFRYDQNINYRKNATPYNSAPKQGVEPILFDYAKTIGIDINKSQIGLSTTNRKDLTKSAYYEDNIAILDNWVYNHGNKGFEIAGEWMVVRRNKNMRDFLQDGDNVYGVGSGWRLTMDGWQVTYETDDNMARGIDLGGKSLWVDSNYFNNVGSNPGNDGEGILCQRHNDVETFSWAQTNNSKGPNGDNSYIGEWDVHIIGNLIFKNTILAGTVGHFNLYATSTNVVCATAYVGNTANSVSSAYGIILDPVVIACPSSAPAAPTSIVTQADNDNSRIHITWQDNANNEIGFRIERRTSVGGTWKTIAYRPMQASAPTTNLGYANLGNPNAPEWYDYCAPTGVAVQYRVVAIDCNDNAAGASAASSSVTLAGATIIHQSIPIASHALSIIYSKQMLLILNHSMLSAHSNIRITDCAGRLVLTISVPSLGNGSLQIPCNLVPGVYTVEFRNSISRWNQRFLVTE